jgi:hypothetical protein
LPLATHAATDPPFLGHLVEPSSLGFEHGALAGELFTRPEDDIAVLRLQFNQQCLPVSLLASDERRARPGKRIERRIPALARVANRLLDQLQRLHRRVQVVDEGLLDEPHVALVAGAAPTVVRTFLLAVKNRHVLPLVIRPPHREHVLGPDEERRLVTARLGERPVAACSSDGDMQI